MHLLYCDESNLEERAGDFLLYGGVAISSEQAIPLSQRIDEIRRAAGIDRSFRLKFNPGPENISHLEFIEVKRGILEAAAAHSVKLLVYVVLHDIATNPDEARRNGINTVCFHFDCMLQRLGSPGLVLIDRFNDNGNRIDAHLADKFSVGLTGLPYSNEMRLSRIAGFHYSAIGQSHFTSLIDIVLGSLRFAINAHTRAQQQHAATATRLLHLLSPLFFREAGSNTIPEIGFLFSPKIVNSARYRERYQSLKEYFAAAGLQLEQPITAERRY